ncbi:radical SAM protein [Mycolicibacillus trivialis]|uniref:radical SAM protein n=1 Tax=Mycolicibacillus trivialis TaxID=1798 RepID=UPI000A149741
MFSLAIVKLTAVCNLNCTYCYMFNQHDRTFEVVPRNMPPAIAGRVVDRIVEHCNKTGIDQFTLSLHGGEPTLWPYSSFVELLDRVEAVRRTGLRLSVGLQTNGLRISDKLADLLAGHQVSLGVSIDGPRDVNDKARVTHSGRGSHDQIMATVQRLIDRGHEDALAGFLCVAQPDLSPKIFLNWISSLPVPRIDVLWPLEYNYDSRPWHGGDETHYARSPRYGTWMARLFKEWLKQDDPKIMIRSFYEIISVILGSNYHSYSLVNQTIPILVINTDGGLEYHDYLRSYKNGGTRSKFNIIDHNFDEFMADPMVNYLLHLGQFLPSECRRCSVVDICGGGHLAGRVGADAMPPFQRSVLCHDQHRLYMTAKELLLDEVDHESPPPFETPSQPSGWIKS